MLIGTLAGRSHLLLDQREAWECSTSDPLVAKNEAAGARIHTVYIQNAYDALVGVVRRDAESVALARLKIVKGSCLRTLDRGKEVVDGGVTTLEEELGYRAKKEKILLASL